MAITTYGELQAAAANWLVRGDLVARIPEFIVLAEARLNRVLRPRLAETEAALTGVIGARTLALPTGFTEPLRVWRVRPEGREELPFQEASRMAAYAMPGEPTAWGVDGATLAFDRPCDLAYGFVLRMLKAFALNDAAPVNGLLAEAPDIYLYATLSEAAPFLRDGQLADAYETKLARAISELNAKDARSRAARKLTTDLPAKTLGWAA